MNNIGANNHFASYGNRSLPNNSATAAARLSISPMMDGTGNSKLSIDF
jgi:hypothetical protein